MLRPLWGVHPLASASSGALGPRSAFELHTPGLEDFNTAATRNKQTSPYERTSAIPSLLISPNICISPGWNTLQLWLAPCFPTEPLSCPPGGPPSSSDIRASKANPPGLAPIQPANRKSSSSSRSAAIQTLESNKGPPPFNPLSESTPTKPPQPNQPHLPLAPPPKKNKPMWKPQQLVDRNCFSL